MKDALWRLASVILDPGNVSSDSRGARAERSNHGRVLRVCGGERESEDQRGDREAAAERQEGFPQGAEAAAPR